MPAITPRTLRNARGDNPAAVPGAGANPHLHPQPQHHWTPLVIRLAVAADERPLRRLAHLDSTRPLSGGAVIAEQAGSIVAAVSLTDGRAIADPFTATAGIVAVLHLRADQLRQDLPSAA